MGSVISPIEEYHFYSLGPYMELCSRILKLCKYHNHNRLFQEVLRYQISIHLKYQPEFMQRLDCADICWVPIPLHWTRHRDRGFNQAKLVAEVYANFLGGSVVDALIRPKENQSLTSMGKAQRTTASQDIFSKKPILANLKNVVIVDDVITTGNTLLAATALFEKENLFHEFQMATGWKGLGNLKSDWELELLENK